MPDRDYVQHTSSLTFSETVDHLVATIETVGMNVFAKIDHAAGAKDVGMSLPSSVVLIYGHARGGTPVMQAAPAAALDLPLRVLIRETDRGETVIAFHPARQMLAHHSYSRRVGRPAGESPAAACRRNPGQSQQVGVARTGFAMVRYGSEYLTLSMT